MLKKCLTECGGLGKHFTKDLQRDEKENQATWDLHQWATNVYNETKLDKSRYIMNPDASLGFTVYADGEQRLMCWWNVYLLGRLGR
jgi:hypothetical protein